MTRAARKRKVTPDAVLRAMEDEPGPLPDAVAAAWNDAIVEGLIRGETADERLTMIAIQVDHTMRLVEAMAGLLMAFGYAVRDEENAHPEIEKMPDPVKAAFARLEDAMRGDAA